MILISKYLVTKTPRRLRVAVQIPLGITTQEGVIASVQGDLAGLKEECDALLIEIYQDRAAVRFGGWVARVTWQRGQRAQITFDNEPEVRRELWRNFR